MSDSSATTALPSAEQGFVLSERLIAGAPHTLVVPRKDKFDWTEPERAFRSTIVDPEGRIVSIGFPKFFNAGEHEGDTARLRTGLASGRVVFSEKMDGSLVIRSVIGGEVVLRTRGTVDGGDHGPHIRRVAAARYPQLMDPGFEPERSLLLEFISPEFPIVIRYPEPDLVLLGMSEHRPGGLRPRSDAEDLARDAGLRMAPVHELPGDLEELLEAVRVYENTEGVVAETDGGLTLVKVKSAAYLAQHALRFAFTPRRVAEFITERELRSEDAFLEALRDEGYDWEVATETRRSFALLADAWAESERRVAAAGEYVEANRHRDRKDFAITAKENRVPDMPVLFMLLDGKTDRAAEKLRDQLMAEAIREANARGLVFADEDG